MKLLFLYPSYIPIIVIWGVVGVLAGWMMRPEGILSIPAWDSVETTIHNLSIIGICTVPHVIIGGLVLSLFTSIFSIKTAMIVGNIPIFYSGAIAALFIYSMFRSPHPSDQVKKIYDKKEDREIVIAIFKRNKTVVQEFIKNGGDIHLQASQRISPLMLAARECDHKTLKFLLEMGVSPNGPKDIEQDDSALLILWRNAYLTTSSNKGCLKKANSLLIEAGARVEPFRRKLLKEVVQTAKDPYYLDLFLKNPTKEELDDYARTSVFFQQFDIFDKLLEYGADPFWKPGPKANNAYEELKERRYLRGSKSLQLVKKLFPEKVK